MRQVNELLKHAVSEAINREVELPRGSFITITEVHTSRDLKHADVYVMVLPDGKRVSTLRSLQSQLGRVQRALGKQIKIKFTPKLRFLFDEGQIRAQGVYDSIDTADQETGAVE